MIFNRSVLIFLFFTSLFYGCTKHYEEDGFFTRFVSLRKRFVGSWQMEKLLVAGVDSSFIIKSDSVFSKIVITDLNDRLIASVDKISSYNDSAVLTIGLAAVIIKTPDKATDKEEVQFIVGGYNELVQRRVIKVRGAINNFGIKWHIMRLSKSEMHLLANHNGIEYRINFKKVGTP